MNSQSWLSRLLRRKSDQQGATQVPQLSPSVPLPQSSDKSDQTSPMSVIEQRAAQKPPVGTSPVPKDAQGAVWHIGEELLNQYEVLGTLGEGGMGTVYKVHHWGWNIDLAVKSPRPAIFARADGKENFIREAETWVNLPLHPHIVSCYYVRLIDEIPRIFAEYVEGGSLADWIGSRRLYEGGHQQALECMLDIAIQFAWGLHAAHEQGLVHQDIKPANVMMSAEGVAKVTDFGLAKARVMAGERGNEEDNGRHSILVSSRGMTPAYCSPEQAAGKALSRKTDIWSWGASLLEMWVGEVTWRSGMLAREVLASYEPQEAAIPPIPAELVKLLARCFEARPEDRPATMLEVATTLQEIYARETGQAYPREMPQAARMQADTLNNRALSLYDLGRVEAALQIWEQALQIDPQHLETTYNQGVVLWRRGEITDETLVHRLKTISTIQPSQAAYLLAQVHLERGDVDASLPLLQQTVQQLPIATAARALLERAQTGNTPAHRSVNIFRGHTNQGITVSLSADGRWLASGCRDKTVRLWDVSTGRCLYAFQAYAWWVMGVSLSADGRWLASTGGFDQTVQLWEARTGQCVRTFSHTAGIGSVSLSPDGRWLASASQDKTVRLWEARTGQCVRTFQDHTNYSRASVSLSADGRWLVSTGGSDLTVRLWDAVTGTCVRIFQGHTGNVSSVHLSADGCWLATASWDHTVRLWNVSTGQCVRTFQGHTNAVETVSLSADGRWLASGSADTTVRSWEIKNPADACCSFYLSHVLSYATITQAETHAEHLLKQIELAQSEHRFPTALSLLREIRALPGWEYTPKSVEAWAKLALHCSRVSFRTTWLSRAFSHTNKPTVASPSADGRWLASVSQDETVQLWEVSTGKCVRTFQGVNPVSLSADGRWLVASSKDKTVRLWEANTGRCVFSYEDPADALRSVNLSTDGRWLVSHSKDKTVRLWEVSTGRCVRTFHNLYSPVTLSADGRLLASGGIGTVDLWNVGTGQCVHTFRGHAVVVYAVIFSDDGNWLVSTVGNIIYLWDVGTGQCIRTFQGHKGVVEAVSLSSDGRWLVSGSVDKTVRLWEVSTGQGVHTFQGYASVVYAVSLSRDGRWLASADAEMVQLWELDWELEAHEPADWDEGARPFLELFLTQNTPYAGELPRNREPTEQEIQQVLTHKGPPTWNEEDFQGLIRQLQYIGYGWLRPEGVRKQLASMVCEQ